jgi:hypothetical protein
MDTLFKTPSSDTLEIVQMRVLARSCSIQTLEENTHESGFQGVQFLLNMSPRVIWHYFRDSRQQALQVYVRRSSMVILVGLQLVGRYFPL